MPKINQLDAHLANMIAAGEVVERPASVVKELVENSIDAAATRIVVSVVEAGIKEIVVIDDGCGMSKEDALLSFGRHATSKIKNERDLFRINTLGFRGEAVPSIASVSEFSLLTSEGIDGYEVVYKGGSKISDGPKASKKGTTITVKNLFFNTPARLKYLKSVSTELAAISEIMQKFALSNPNISFTLKSEGEKILETSGKGDIVRLFGEIYGYNVAKNLVISEFKNFSYEIKLVLIKSMINRSNKKEMTTICNNRYVKSYKFNDAIKEAYDTYIPHTRYPISCIYLTLEPMLVDVNVHPSKAIIKISNEDEIASTLKSMASKMLKESNLIPLIKEEKKEHLFEQQSFINEEFNNKIVEEKSLNANSNIESKIQDIKNEELKFSEESIIYNENSNKLIHEEELTKIKEDDKYLSPNMQKTQRLPYLEYVGQLHGTYLIFQNEEGAYIIDQHAAAERINYEKYYNLLSHPQKATTKLLISYPLEFSAQEMIFVEQNLEKLKEVGILMDQISQNAYAIREVPYWMDFDNIDVFIHNLIDDFYQDKDVSIIKQRDRISKQIACKSSIRANRKVTSIEALNLVEQLNKCNNPYTCPHGRPTIIRLENKYFEKLFLREM